VSGRSSEFQRPTKKQNASGEPALISILSVDGLAVRSESMESEVAALDGPSS
jgi:hypothetical protein